MLGNSPTTASYPASGSGPGLVTIPAGDLTGDGASLTNPTIGQLTGLAGLVAAATDNTIALGNATKRFLSLSLAANLSIFLASADANPRTRLGDQSLHFGFGGASALDTRIFRTAASQVTIDNESGGTATFVFKNVLSLQQLGSDFMQMGAPSATQGTVRFPSGGSIFLRNAGNTGDLRAFVTDGADQFAFGDSNNANMIFQTAGAISFQTPGSFGTTFKFAALQGTANSQTGRNQWVTGVARITGTNNGNVGSYVPAAGDIAIVCVTVIAKDPTTPANSFSTTLIGTFKNTAGVVAQVGATTILQPAIAVGTLATATAVFGVNGGANVTVVCTNPAAGGPANVDWQAAYDNIED